MCAIRVTQNANFHCMYLFTSSKVLLYLSIGVFVNWRICSLVYLYIGVFGGLPVKRGQPPNVAVEHLNDVVSIPYVRLNADNPPTLQMNTCMMTLFLSLTSDGAAAERGQPADVTAGHLYDDVVSIPHVTCMMTLFLSLTSGWAVAERGQPADVAMEHLLV